VLALCLTSCQKVLGDMLLCHGFWKSKCHALSGRNLEMMGKETNQCNFLFLCCYLYDNTHFLEVFLHHHAFQERPCTLQGMASSDGSFNPLQKIQKTINLCTSQKDNQCEIAMCCHLPCSQGS